MSFTNIKNKYKYHDHTVLTKYKSHSYTLMQTCLKKAGNLILKINNDYCDNTGVTTLAMSTTWDILRVECMYYPWNHYVNCQYT